MFQNARLFVKNYPFFVKLDTFSGIPTIFVIFRQNPALSKC